MYAILSSSNGLLSVMMSLNEITFESWVSQTYSKVHVYIKKKISILVTCSEESLCRAKWLESLTTRSVEFHSVKILPRFWAINLIVLKRKTVYACEQSAIEECFYSWVVRKVGCFCFTLSKVINALEKFTLIEKLLRVQGNSKMYSSS